MVLAETDADARAAACHAYPAWRTNMERLWKQRGVPFPLDLPNAFDDYQRAGFGFAGTAAGARDYIREQIETGGINYLVCGVAFGALPLAAALRTADLLAREVLPAFADDTQVADAG